MKLTAKQIYKLFIHRKDVFSEQQGSGGYFPTRRPITLTDIEEHLNGKRTLGAYALDTDNTVKWACIDLDDKDNPEKLRGEAEIVYNLFKDFPRLLEWSGRKGFHIWIFFNPSVTADWAQKLVRARLGRPMLGLNRFEVFPKQTELNEARKYGNLVKLPCGLHRKSRKYSKILKADLEGLI